MFFYVLFVYLWFQRVLCQTNMTTTSVFSNPQSNPPTATTYTPSTKPTAYPTLQPTDFPTLALDTSNSEDPKIVLITLATKLCGMTIETFKMEIDALNAIFSNVFNTICSALNNVCEFNESPTTSNTCTTAQRRLVNVRRLATGGIVADFKIGINDPKDVQNVVNNINLANSDASNAVSNAFPGVTTALSVTSVSVVSKNDVFNIKELTFGELILSPYLFIGLIMIIIGVVWLIFLRSDINNDGYNALNNTDIEKSTPNDDKKMSKEEKNVATAIEMQEKETNETKDETKVEETKGNESNNNETKATNDTPTNAKATNDASTNAEATNDATTNAKDTKSEDTKAGDDVIKKKKTKEEAFMEDAWNSGDEN